MVKKKKREPVKTSPDKIQRLKDLGATQGQIQRQKDIDAGIRTQQDIGVSLERKKRIEEGKSLFETAKRRGISGSLDTRTGKVVDISGKPITQETIKRHELERKGQTGIVPTTPEELAAVKAKEEEERTAGFETRTGLQRDIGTLTGEERDPSQVVGEQEVTIINDQGVEETLKIPFTNEQLDAARKAEAGREFELASAGAAGLGGLGSVMGGIGTAAKGATTTGGAGGRLMKTASGKIKLVKDDLLAIPEEGISGLKGGFASVGTAIDKGAGTAKKGLSYKKAIENVRSKKTITDISKANKISREQATKIFESGKKGGADKLLDKLIKFSTRADVIGVQFLAFWGGADTLASFFVVGGARRTVDDVKFNNLDNESANARLDELQQTLSTTSDSINLIKWINPVMGWAHSKFYADTILQEAQREIDTAREDISRLTGQ